MDMKNMKETLEQEGSARYKGREMKTLATKRMKKLVDKHAQGMQDVKH